MAISKMAVSAIFGQKSPQKSIPLLTFFGPTPIRNADSDLNFYVKQTLKSLVVHVQRGIWRGIGSIGRQVQKVR